MLCKRYLVVSCLLVSQIGCESDVPWDMVKVSGKVTYEDGTLIPASAIRLSFKSLAPPINSKVHPRPGRVSVNVEDGTFENVTTHKYGDGLIVGKHKVLVVALASESGQESSQVVPEDYTTSSATPIEIDTADSPLHIKVAKPLLSGRLENFSNASGQFAGR